MTVASRSGDHIIQDNLTLGVLRHVTSVLVLAAGQHQCVFRMVTSCRSVLLGMDGIWLKTIKMVHAGTCLKLPAKAAFKLQDAIHLLGML